MKNIIFLILIMGFFSPLINAYEYLIYNNPNDNRSQRYFLDNSNDQLIIKNIFIDGNETYTYVNAAFYNILNGIKNNIRGYISNNDFLLLLQLDKKLLNDFYLQKLNPILNYLYNDNSFGQTNYIDYENYVILYDENGLAVESIVNGVWKGLYNTEEELNNSGWLYDKQNNIYYYNQYEASFIGQLEHKLLKFFKNSIIGVFSLNVIGIVLIFIFACVILRVVLNLVHHFLTRSRFNFNIGKKL